MCSDQIPTFHFDTEQISSRDGYDIWRNVLGEFYEVAPPPLEASRPAFAAKLDVWNLSGVLLTAGSYSPQRFSRSQERVRRDGFDHYTILLHRNGIWRTRAEDRVVESAAGRICVLDFARPSITEVTFNDSVTLSLPREMLDSALPPRDLHGIALEGPHAALLSDFMVSLSTRLAGVTAAEAPHLAAACRDLLAACLAPSPARIERAQPQLDMLLLRRAKRLIETKLHDPDWGPEQLASELAVSRSRLYYAFERFGGVAAYVRDRRLARAHVLLCASEGRGRVSDIGAACGFRSDAQFSRAFRAAYGYTAREAMLRPATPAQHPAGDTGAIRADQALAWVRALCR